MTHRKKPHTATYRGKRVYIKLVDGTTFFDRFMDRTDRWVVLKEHGKILMSDIKAFSNCRSGAGL